MAKVFYREDSYLLDQEQRYEEKSKYTFWAALVIVFILLVITYWITHSNLSGTAKIVFYVIISPVLFYYLYGLLFDYSKYSSTAFKFSFGFSGEAKVFNELAKLPDEYSVLYDAQIDKYGNIDFVVYKNNLFFNIEVKNHSGHISFDGVHLYRNGYPFPGQDPSGQVLRNEQKIRNAFE